MAVRRRKILELVETLLKEANVNAPNKAMHRLGFRVADAVRNEEVA